MMQLWIKFDGYDTWYYNLLFDGFFTDIGLGLWILFVSQDDIGFES